MKVSALAMMVALAAAGVAFGQVPTRPGLPVHSAVPVTPPPVAGAPRTTELVQHQYDAMGQPIPAHQPGPVMQQDGEFFFIDEASAAPGEFASQLSDHNAEVMQRAGNQLRGDYGAIDRSGMPAGQTQDAWDRPFDNMSAGQSAPGVVRYQWSADLVMPVRLRAGMVTSLVLPDWEAAEDVVIGDGGSIEATILRSNVVGLKSITTGTDTSVSVIGASGNLYTFYLRTEGRNTRVVTDLQVFVQAGPSKSSAAWFNDERRNIFIGQAEEGAGIRRAPGSITLTDSGSNGDEPVPEDKRIFNLKMYEMKKGDAIIAPEYAYTDGRFTYLHFPAGVTDRPAIFRSVDGVEGRVNTRVMGRHSEIIVVEALGNFVLRSGTRVVCIVSVNDEDGLPLVRS